ncbi:hypothetical protein [Streptomyces phytophilus]|uniref:hypothetical protein n=1 Tax=Streptomyces phytophilus TaxID=722715 RepID=UPI0015F0D111|nr:hypothetical protein [Streptomyces phytophilus]
MYLTGVSLPDFYDITARVSRERYGGNVIVHDGARWSGRNRITARLSVADSRSAGARTSARGRHGRWACWHAHRDVLRAVFQHRPDARVTTMLAAYRGLDDFENTFPDTAHHNIGSLWSPMYMPELCVAADCGEALRPLEGPASDPEYPYDPAAVARVLAKIDAMDRELITRAA